MFQCFFFFIRTVSWLRVLVAGLSLQKAGFDATPIHLRFMVHKVALACVNPEDGAEALKHAGYFNIRVCAFVGMNDK
jgi:hypothetical protein